jgi:oligopeptide transport system ATP-binding protein
MKIRDVIAEVFKTHTTLKKRDIDEAIDDLFGLMGLSASFLGRYPYQLSIGQKRKIGLARALAIVPKFLIADEPFAGLDVSTKRELTWIMQRLQEKYKFGALVISHDLDSVRNLCHRVAVMYKGRILELFDNSSLVNRTVYHPYTQTLLGIKRQGGRTLILRRRACTSSQDTTGCGFLNGCDLYESFNHPHECIESRPKLRALQDNHQVACHLCDRAMESR